MVSELEYAQLAGRVYNATEVNRLPVPLGWVEEIWIPDTSTGFSAGVYRKGDEVVISFTGVEQIAGNHGVECHALQIDARTAQQNPIVF